MSPGSLPVPPRAASPIRAPRAVSPARALAPRLNLGPLVCAPRKERPLPACCAGPLGRSAASLVQLGGHLREGPRGSPRLTPSALVVFLSWGDKEHRAGQDGAGRGKGGPRAGRGDPGDWKGRHRDARSAFRLSLVPCGSGVSASSGPRRSRNWAQTQCGRHRAAGLTQRTDRLAVPRIMFTSCVRGLTSEAT